MKLNKSSCVRTWAGATLGWESETQIRGAHSSQSCVTDLCHRVFRLRVGISGAREFVHTEIGANSTLALSGVFRICVQCREWVSWVWTHSWLSHLLCDAVPPDPSQSWNDCPGIFGGRTRSEFLRSMKTDPLPGAPEGEKWWKSVILGPRRGV